MTISLRLVDKPADIQKTILKLLAQELDGTISKAAKNIRATTVEFVKETIEEASAIKDLTTGTLRGHFGLSASQAREAADAISQAIADTVQITPSKVSITGNNFKGGLTVTVQPNNLSNILSLPEGKITYYSKTYKKDVTLDWLNWILKKGDAVIVKKFDFVLEGGKGRSGLGTMKKEGTWRVPPSVSGTIDDNFITKAFESETVSSSMLKIINDGMAKLWG